MSSVAQAMLRIYGRLDASSIEAARNVAKWARERGYDAAPYEAEIAQAEQRATQERARHEAALRLMDEVRI
jgi:hypothetical protein